MFRPQKSEDVEKFDFSTSSLFIEVVSLSPTLPSRFCRRESLPYTR